LFRTAAGDSYSATAGNNPEEPTVIKPHLASAFALTFIISLSVADVAPAQTSAVPRSERGIGRDLGTSETGMLTGLAGWRSAAAFTIGEEVNGYLAPGIPDGMGAIALDHRRVRVFLNHEIAAEKAYPYRLANGTTLTGARVSYLDFHRQSRKLLGAGPAFDTVVDRYGEVVTAARQINEDSGRVATDGLDRLCSAWLGRAGSYGLVDDAFFTGEETGSGQEFVLDVHAGILHCAPALGRAAFESVAMIDHPDPDLVAVVIGDDRPAAPLLVYVGTRNALGDGGFLDRNGLARGRLYVWVSGEGDTSAATFRGTGASRTGDLVEIPYFDPLRAGLPGYDRQGYADRSVQDDLAAAAGAFRFSRPEDVSTNPADGSQVVMASTGRSNLFGGADSWGTTYLIDFDLAHMTAALTIAYDGDDAGGGRFAGPDFGLRSPDNLVWADDGLIYIQEDRSVGGFGRTSGEETSMWQLDPASGAMLRVARIDRLAVPRGQYDFIPGDVGNWENSGVIDVTALFRTSAKERLLLATVQAHSVRGEIINRENLVEGGQVLFLSSKSHPLMDKLADTAGVTPAAIPLAVGPNPFNPRTVISFGLDQEAEVSLRIFDLRGQLVRTIIAGRLAAGPHAETWDGLDRQGRAVASGTYLVQLKGAGRLQTGKAVLIR
jgi:hypothetical protein